MPINSLTPAKVLLSMLLFIVGIVGIFCFSINSPVSAAGCSVEEIKNSGNIGTGAECAATGTDIVNNTIDGGVVSKITNTILFIVGAVAVIMLIYGGFQYVTSGGDSGKVTNAKNTIMYAVIGIIVALLSYAILGFVTGMIK